MTDHIYVAYNLCYEFKLLQGPRGERGETGSPGAAGPPGESVSNTCFINVGFAGALELNFNTQI